MFFLKKLLIVFLVTFSSCSFSEIGKNFILVNKVKRVEILKNEKISVKYKTESEVEIKIPNACAPYKITYFSTGKVDGSYEDTIALVVMPGEYCDISNYVFSHPTLVSISKKNGEKFLDGYAELKIDEHNKFYLYEFDVIKKLNLTKFLVDLNIENNFEACRSEKYISEVDKKRLLESPNVLKVKNDICFVKGVYLDTLISDGILKLGAE